LDYDTLLLRLILLHETWKAGYKEKSHIWKLVSQGMISRLKDDQLIRSDGPLPAPRSCRDRFDDLYREFLSRQQQPELHQQHHGGHLTKGLPVNEVEVHPDILFEMPPSSSAYYAIKILILRIFSVGFINGNRLEIKRISIRAATTFETKNK
jgi:hypothetical protein